MGLWRPGSARRAYVENRGVYRVLKRLKQSLLPRWTALLVLVSLGVEGVFLPVQAAYEHPLTWSDMSDFDLRPVLKSEYASQANLLEPEISKSALAVAMKDADNLISPVFAVPKDLEASVHFWLRMYTEFTTQQVVLFDSRHPEIVYDVLDFRPLAKTVRGPIAYEVTTKKRVRAAMAAYRKAFASLSKRRKLAELTYEEKQILAATAGHPHKHSFKQLARNLRSQTGQRDNIVKGLLAAEAYLPKMEELFRRVGTPPELTRLALVESSFNLHATSRVGAAGIWQFMETPGKQFLLIDKSAKIDERLSPLKSTVAAGRLLNENFKRFRSWPLAVTSYNHGLKGLRPYHKGKGGEDFSKIAHLFDSCNRRGPLGWAGKNYYSEFLAVLRAEAYRKTFYGEPPASGVRSVVFTAAPTGKTPLRFAMESGIGIQEFRFLNPDIRDIRRPLPIGFLVAVPGPTDDLASLIRLDRRQARLSRQSKKTPI